MRIAVTSQNFRTITGHAGKTRRFLVFEAEPGGEPREVERLDLPKELSFHEYRGNEAHPVDGVAVIITTSAGAGFVHRVITSYSIHYTKLYDAALGAARIAVRET